MFITANVAITAVMAIVAMGTIFTTGIMTNISKIAKLVDDKVISCSMVIRAVVAIRIIMESTGIQIQTAWPIPQLWL